MFSLAESIGRRLKAWNTNPMRSRRRRVSSFSDSRDRSTSPIHTDPEVRVSRPARQCMRVDLPEPEGPMMAVNRPAGTARLTLSRARTAVSPRPYTLVTASARAAGRGKSPSGHIAESASLVMMSFGVIPATVRRPGRRVTGAARRLGGGVVPTPRVGVVL
jgi:hypothetical protein